MARFASARISSFPHISALIADNTHGFLSGAIDRLLSWGQARTVDAGEAC